MKKINFITQNTLCLLVGHLNNSYVELWDIQFERIIAVYDRYFFKTDELQLVDMTSTHMQVHLLDYKNGVYTLQLMDGALIISDMRQMSMFSHLTADEDSLIVSRNTMLTEIRKGVSTEQIFKY